VTVLYRVRVYDDVIILCARMRSKGRVVAVSVSQLVVSQSVDTE